LRPEQKFFKKTQKKLLKLAGSLTYSAKFAVNEILRSVPKPFLINDFYVPARALFKNRVRAGALFRRYESRFPARFAGFPG
jgi:hypothetical protein